MMMKRIIIIRALTLPVTFNQQSQQIMVTKMTNRETVSLEEAREQAQHNINNNIEQIVDRIRTKMKDSAPVPVMVRTKMKDSKTVPVMVMCRCKNSAELRIVTKEGENKGRYFYNCKRSQLPGSCKFFEWADDSFSPTASARPLQPPGDELGGRHQSCTHNESYNISIKVCKEGLNLEVHLQQKD